MLILTYARAGDEALKQPNSHFPVRLACQSSFGQAVSFVVGVRWPGCGRSWSSPAAGSLVSMFRYGWWLSCFIRKSTLILECTQPGSSSLICRAPCAQYPSKRYYRTYHQHGVSPHSLLGHRIHSRDNFGELETAAQLDREAISTTCGVVNQ